MRFLRSAYLSVVACLSPVVPLGGTKEGAKSDRTAVATFDKRGFAGIETLVVVGVLVASVILGVNAVRNESQDTRNFAREDGVTDPYCRSNLNCPAGCVPTLGGGYCRPTPAPTAVPTTAPAICNPGAYRCNNGSREQCNGGIWIVQQVCQHGCENNTCKPAPTTAADCRTNGCGNNRACLRIDGIWQCVRHTPTPTRRPTNTPIPDCRSQGCSGASSCLPQDGRFVCVAHTPTPASQASCPSSCANGCNYNPVTQTYTCRPTPTLTPRPTNIPATPTPFCDTRIIQGCASGGMVCQPTSKGGVCGAKFTPTPPPPTPDTRPNCIPSLQVDVSVTGSVACKSKVGDRYIGFWMCPLGTSLNRSVGANGACVRPPEIVTNLGVGSLCNGNANSTATRRCATNLTCPTYLGSNARCVIAATSTPRPTASPIPTRSPYCSQTMLNECRSLPGECVPSSSGGTCVPSSFQQNQGLVNLNIGICNQNSAVECRGKSVAGGKLYVRQSSGLWKSGVCRRNQDSVPTNLTCLFIADPGTLTTEQVNGQYQQAITTPTSTPTRTPTPTSILSYGSGVCPAECPNNCTYNPVAGETVCRGVTPTPVCMVTNLTYTSSTLQYGGRGCCSATAEVTDVGGGQKRCIEPRTLKENGADCTAGYECRDGVCDSQLGICTNNGSQSACSPNCVAGCYPRPAGASETQPLTCRPYCDTTRCVGGCSALTPNGGVCRVPPSPQPTNVPPTPTPAPQPLNFGDICNPGNNILFGWATACNQCPLGRHTWDWGRPVCGSNQEEFVDLSNTEPRCNTVDHSIESSFLTRVPNSTSCIWELSEYNIGVRFYTCNEGYKKEGGGCIPESQLPNCIAAQLVETGEVEGSIGCTDVITSGQDSVVVRSVNRWMCPEGTRVSYGVGPNGICTGEQSNTGGNSSGSTLVPIGPGIMCFGSVDCSCVVNSVEYTTVIPGVRCPQAPVSTPVVPFTTTAPVGPSPANSTPPAPETPLCVSNNFPKAFGTCCSGYSTTGPFGWQWCRVAPEPVVSEGDIPQAIGPGMQCRSNLRCSCSDGTGNEHAIIYINPGEFCPSQIIHTPSPRNTPTLAPADSVAEATPVPTSAPVASTLQPGDVCNAPGFINWGYTSCEACPYGHEWTGFIAQWPVCKASSSEPVPTAIEYGPNLPDIQAGVRCVADDGCECFDNEGYYQTVSQGIICPQRPSPRNTPTLAPAELTALAETCTNQDKCTNFNDPTRCESVGTRISAGTQIHECRETGGTFNFVNVTDVVDTPALTPTPLPWWQAFVPQCVANGLPRGMSVCCSGYSEPGLLGFEWCKASQQDIVNSSGTTGASGPSSFVPTPIPYTIGPSTSTELLANGAEACRSESSLFTSQVNRSYPCWSINQNRQMFECNEGTGNLNGSCVSMPSCSSNGLLDSATANASPCRQANGRVFYECNAGTGSLNGQCITMPLCSKPIGWNPSVANARTCRDAASGLTLHECLGTRTLVGGSCVLSTPTPTSPILEPVEENSPCPQSEALACKDGKRCRLQTAGWQYVSDPSCPQPTPVPPAISVCNASTDGKILSGGCCYHNPLTDEYQFVSATNPYCEVRATPLPTPVIVGPTPFCRDNKLSQCREEGKLCLKTSAGGECIPIGPTPYCLDSRLAECLSTGQICLQSTTGGTCISSTPRVTPVRCAGICAREQDGAWCRNAGGEMRPDQICSAAGEDYGYICCGVPKEGTPTPRPQNPGQPPVNPPTSCENRGGLNQVCRTPQECNNAPNCNDGLYCDGGICKTPPPNTCGTGNCLVCTCSACYNHGAGLGECRPGDPGAVCSVMACSQAQALNTCGQIDFLDANGNYCGVKQQACTGSCTPSSSSGGGNSGTGPGSGGGTQPTPTPAKRRNYSLCQRDNQCRSNRCERLVPFTPKLCLPKRLEISPTPTP